MFYIALVILLHCFFHSSGYNHKVGGQQFVHIDLLEGLRLRNNSYVGVSLGIDVQMKGPGVTFTGDFRKTLFPPHSVDIIKSQFSSPQARDFTITTVIKQQPNNVGTLLSFSTGLISALEIQSSGRKNELRLLSGSSVETFPFRLADGGWHRLAISFSSNQVNIFIDCLPKFKRVLKFDPGSSISTSKNISLWIGQQTTTHFLYQGKMQDLRLSFGPYGYLSQCPDVDSECPTCSEFNELKISFTQLQAQLAVLTDRLNKAEARLTNVEQCECRKSCRVNETSIVDDGTVWYKECNTCKCKKGGIECHPIHCSIPRCKAPVLHPGECCPTCLKQCFFRGRMYEHGDAEPLQNCVECECTDGSMQCVRRDPQKTCPSLPCLKSEQISVPGECCKVCPGTDYCAKNNKKCHRNATCVNLETTFTCQCKEGFVGNGMERCEDIDECLLEKHHCGKNSKCVNMPGDYKCDCLVGFRRIDQYQCEDHDECADEHMKGCHSIAVCENTVGSYRCRCPEGYSGDGYQCAPICIRGCDNGGICIAPNTCSCRRGWTGPFCETDLDECSEMSNGTNAILCPANSICINKPGWYLCECKVGFIPVISGDGTAMCNDIDECDGFDPCPDGFTCVNSVGSYECHCPPQKHNLCSPGCFDEGNLYLPGTEWLNRNCHICTCTSPGAISCLAIFNDTCSQICSFNTSLNEIEDMHQCCTPCSNHSSKVSRADFVLRKSCQHQIYPDLNFKSGDSWHFHCQTCECLDGEVDCWPIDCPPISCNDPILPLGDCCLRCPEEEQPNECTHFKRNNTFSSCNLLENSIESGTRITLPHNNCITCKCQEGELCCTYDYDCISLKTNE